MIQIRIEHGADKYTKQPNSFNVKFIDAGYRLLEENGTLKPRFLDRHEMIFVSKGTLAVRASDREYAQAANGLLLLAPYQTVAIRNVNHAAAAFYRVRFTAERLERFGNAAPFTALRNPGDYLKWFKELIYGLQASRLPGYTGDVVVALILCYLLGEDSRCDSGGGGNRIDTIGMLEWIHEHAGADLNVQAVCDAFNYSKDYLGKVFKQEVGATIKEYINRTQMNKAKELLTTTDYPVKRIAQILHYEDANLFIKFFTYHERIGPSRYRSLRGGQA